MVKGPSYSGRDNYEEHKEEVHYEINTTHKDCDFEFLKKQLIKVEYYLKSTLNVIVGS